MDFAALRAKLGEVDSSSLSEPELRQWLSVLSTGFVSLLDAHLVALEKLEEATAGLQAAQAEIRRLKGLPDPPDRSGPNPPGGGAPGRRNLSSERERRKRRGPSQRGKHPRRAHPTPTESLVITCDPASLPPDAVRKGARRVLKQDLSVRARVVEMWLERWYSPSERKSYQAPIPAGWEGGYGPTVKALTLLFCHGLNQSQEPLGEFYRQSGLVISAGKLAGLALGNQELFGPEREEVLQAALDSCPWHQTDMTPTTVMGKPETCQVLGNPTYTHYETGPGHDRAAVIRLLLGQRAESYLLNGETLEYLRARGWSQRRLKVLERFLHPMPQERAYFEGQLRWRLDGWPQSVEDEFWSAALVMCYRGDSAIPPVRALLTDDASIYAEIAEDHPLCWIHHLRHYKELQPRFTYHWGEVDRVLRQAWRLYQQLEAYRAEPSAAAAERLRKRFDRCFGQSVTYPELQVTLRRTLAKKERLLLVLKHPELPLHNNSAELDARRRVRRRDVSFGPRTREGARAWDLFQGLAATTRKLGVCFYDYLLDRITQAGDIPRLETLVRKKSQELGLGKSWQAASATS